MRAGRRGAFALVATKYIAFQQTGEVVCVGLSQRVWALVRTTPQCAEVTSRQGLASRHARVLMHCARCHDAMHSSDSDSSLHMH